MNKEQFIYWLKGFTSAIEETPTPKQWETIVSELNKIKDCPDFGSPIGEGGWGTLNTASIQTLPFIQPADPHNPYKLYCGTAGESGVVTTNSIVTDGFIQDSSVTRAQPPFTLTTTSTAYGHPSGSTINYTVNLPEEL
jgi:hypothetical protein